MSKDNKYKEIKSMIKKIVQDHVQYSCSESTYKLMNKNPDPKSDTNMALRRNMLHYIKSKETEKAFLKLKMFDTIDPNLLVNLAKLSFIDFVSRDQILEGIEFAKEHFTMKMDKSVYTLVGYGMKDQEEYERIAKGVDRNRILQEVNSFLYNSHCAMVSNIYMVRCCGSSEPNSYGRQNYTGYTGGGYSGNTGGGYSGNTGGGYSGNTGGGYSGNTGGNTGSNYGPSTGGTAGYNGGQSEL
ncbi:hypothetical protein P3W45_001632 [Vairimorpha bombi]